jgi:hypothetical protein
MKLKHVKQQRKESKSKKKLKKAYKGHLLRRRIRNDVYQNQRKFILVIQELCINVTIRLNFAETL